MTSQLISETVTTTTTGTTAKVDPVNISIYGQTIPLLFGASRVKGAPFWAADVITNDDGSRFVTYAAILGHRDPQASSVELYKVWMDDQLAYTNDGNSVAQQAVRFEFYDGNEHQAQSPTIASVEGITKTPAFRDRIYVVINQWFVPLGARFPEITCEVVQKIANTNLRYVDNFDDNRTVDSGAGHTFNSFFAVDFDQDLLYTTIYPSTLQVYDTVSKVKIAQGLLKAGADEYFPIAVARVRSGVYAKGPGGVAVFDPYGVLLAGPFNTGVDAELSPSLSTLGHEQYFAQLATFGGQLRVFTRDGATIAEVQRTYLPGIGFVSSHCHTRWLDNVSPNNDYVLGYFGINALVGIVLVCDNGSAVIGKRTVRYTDADGIAGGSSRDEYLTLSSACKFVADLSTTGINRVMHIQADPLGGKWIGVIGMKADNSVVWVRLRTLFGELGVVSPGHSAGPVPNVAPAMPSINSLTIEDYRDDYGLTFDFATAAVAGRNSAPAGQTQVMIENTGINTNGVLHIIDCADGTHITYPVGTTQYLDGTVLGEAYISPYGTWVQAKRGMYYQYLTGSVNAKRPGFVTLGSDPAQSSKLAVSNLMTSLALLAGFDTNVIETDDIDDTIVGALINVPTKFLDIASVVAELFRIDIVESEGKIKFKRRLRGAEFIVDRLLTEDDLAPVDQGDENDGSILAKERDATATLPAVLQVTYIDSDNDFQLGTQSARRTQYPARTSQGTATEKIGVPIAMPAATCLYWAEYSLFDRWAAALTIRVLVGQEHLDLEPGDYVQLSTANFGSYTVKIKETYLNEDMSMLLTCDNVMAVSPDNANINDIIVQPPTSALPGVNGGKIALMVVDNFSPSPAQGGEIDCTLRCYTSVACDITLTLPGGSTAKTSTLGGTSYGVLAKDLPAIAQPERTHDDFTVDVRFLAGVPIAVPEPPPGADYTKEDTFRAGFAAIAVGAPGRWECIFFRDATKLPDGTYRLSHLMRARYGTDAIPATAKAGDYVIYLGTARPGPFGYTVADIGKDVAVTANYAGSTNTSTARTSRLTLTGGDVKPWSPVHVKATKSGGDVVITWNRRSRGTITFASGVPIEPNVEAFEKYDLEIIAPDGTVKRTALAQTSPVFAYTASQIVADGFDVSSYVHVRIYQLSALVGRGYVRDKQCRVN